MVYLFIFKEIGKWGVLTAPWARFVFGLLCSSGGLPTASHPRPQPSPPTLPLLAALVARPLAVEYSFLLCGHVCTRASVLVLAPAFSCSGCWQALRSSRGASRTQVFQVGFHPQLGGRLGASGLFWLTSVWLLCTATTSGNWWTVLLFSLLTLPLCESPVGLHCVNSLWSSERSDLYFVLRGSFVFGLESKTKCVSVSVYWLL